MSKYMEGFSDAIELFENSINNSLKSGIKSKKDMVKTIDSVIATIYVAKLSLSQAEDDYISNMFEEEIGRSENISIEEFDEMLGLFDIFGEIFNTKGGK